MRYTKKNIVILTSVFLLVFATIVLVVHNDHVVRKSSLDEEKMLNNVFPKSLNKKRIMTRTLRAVNAPKLLDNMQEPRRKFRFDIEPTIIHERIQKGMLHIL